MDLEQIGTVSAGIATLVVKALGSQVTIRRADRDDIAFRANNAESWRLTESGIEQTAVVGEDGIFDGTISNCCIGGIMVDANKDGVWINGKKQKDDPAGTKLNILQKIMAKNSSEMTIGGLRVEVYDGVVFVNGIKQVDDVPDAEASGETVETVKPKDKDELVILVPHSFRGGLDIDFQGKRQLTVGDDWIGGDFILAAGDRTSITLEGSVREVGRFSFDFVGTGVASLKNVSCANGKISIEDRVSFAMGALAIIADGSGKPQPFTIHQHSRGNATVGDITGPAGLTAILSERGALNLGNIDTTSFNLEECGPGNATVGKVTTGEFVSERKERGVLKMGPVVARKARITHGGSDNAQFDGVTCETSLVAIVKERGNLGLGKVACPTFDLTQSDRGGTTTREVECDALTAVLGDRGDWNMGDAKVTDLFKLVQQGRGGTIGGSVSCREFTFQNTDRGNGVFASLQAASANIVNTDRGNVTISAGGAETGKAVNTDRGMVVLPKGFRNLKRENSGRGQIIVG